jgi:hypothetical protein
MEVCDVRQFIVWTAKGIDMHYYTEYDLLAIARKQDGREAERRMSFMELFS